VLKATKSMELMRKEFPNLEQELQQTKTKFEQVDPQKMDESLRGMREERDELKKRINVNVDAMFESTERKHQELLMKRDTLVENKAHIEDTISKLDLEKNKDL
jgi:chromosome segregation ATPase